MMNLTVKGMVIKEILFYILTEFYFYNFKFLSMKIIPHICIRRYCPTARCD